ncbi:response regulator transcription factor [Corallococcus exiguus]|uniref:response regulator transcription factor n=1 Tax=Corallococcus exiguus TaxID=83462 RepID=UPI0015617045|nr:helix-turn-helix transcriptional regulator [Corallococcus exiguus]NRD43929.1 helix-turn-helix transcriptional regulator [Corallococcus exiguus]
MHDLHGATPYPAPSSPHVRAWKLKVSGEIFAVISLPMGLGPHLAALTSAERSVVEHVLRGDSNKQIAHSRGTAVRTVANQLAAIYQKLGIASRSDLVVHVTRLYLQPY